MSWEAEQNPSENLPIFLPFSPKEGFLIPKWSLFVHHWLKEYNFFVYFLPYLHGYMIDLATATQLLPIMLFISFIQNQNFFFPDIQFCARSNFSKNRNECMSFPLLSVNHWQKRPRSDYSSVRSHRHSGLREKNWLFRFILICIHWHPRLEYKGTENFSSLVCCMFLNMGNVELAN